MYLGENIRYLRLKNGFSQEYIANKLGYKSFTTIQKWESGISEPPIKKLKQLSNLFGIDMDDLNNRKLSIDDPLLPLNSALNNFNLSLIEQQIIINYRKADNLDKEMVHRILHIEEKENTITTTA